VLNAKATRWGAFAVTCVLMTGAALRSLRAGDACVFQIERQGNFMFLPFEID